MHCVECGASSVWTGLAEIKLQRGAVNMVWRCGLCGHQWTIKSAAPVRPKVAKATEVRAIAKRRRRS
jgi:hypothetical protein